MVKNLDFFRFAGWNPTNYVTRRQRFFGRIEQARGAGPPLIAALRDLQIELEPRFIRREVALCATVVDLRRRAQLPISCFRKGLPVTSSYSSIAFAASP